MEWCRWHNGTASDPKWRVVAKRAGVPLHMVVAVWPFLVEGANQGKERGTMDDPPDPEVIAAALDMEPGQVAAILEAMQGKVLNGQRLTGWAKRNPKRERDNPDDSSPRVKKHREQGKSVSEPESTTLDYVTPSNASNGPDREIDREIEKKEPTPLPPTAGGRAALIDEMAGDLNRYAEGKFPDPVKRHSFVAGSRGIIAGEDSTSWQDAKARDAPWEDRPRIFRLALDRLASGESNQLRGAVKWATAQQIDPDRVRPAIIGAIQARDGPVNQPPAADHAAAELERLKAEHPEIYAEELASFERSGWWKDEDSKLKVGHLLTAIRASISRPRIVA